MKGDDDLCILSCIVIDLLYLDLPFVIGLDDGIDYICSGDTEGDLVDYQGVFVYFFDLCPHSYPAAAKSSVIAGDVCKASGREVGIEFELFTSEVRDGCVDKFVEVMREDFAGQAYGNTFGTLCQQQWKLDREIDRLAVTAVV